MDYNTKAHLELIDKQAKLLEAMMKPTVTVTEKTLRDEFAMAALPVVLSEWGYPSASEFLVAEKAYKLADAMMEARK